ncbi:MAG: CDP-alcohol phosphatidyltransferase family protein, partial [Syntrophobacteria bacterium]
AAGSGMRFEKATNFCPKPLIEVAGVPLIVRTIQTAQKAGIHRFTIVTGYQAEVFERFLKQKTLPNTEVHCVRNEQWQRANGLSVLKARDAVQEPFLLLMADHLFEERIISRVLASPLPPGHCRLAVDFNPGSVFDLEDATKVHVVDGCILDIGKNLTTYNGVDTGIFLCSRALFEALDTAVSGGAEALSDGVRELARERRMQAVDVGELFWQDVDNAKDLEQGEKRLLRNLVSETDSWLTRHINRIISLGVTRRLARTGVKPNHITLFNFALGLMAAAFMLQGTHAGFVLASSLFLLSSILDGCDGEIARLTFQESRMGAWLDVITDNITHLALFTCMTIGLIRWSGSIIYIIPGALLLGGCLCSVLMSFIAHKRLGRDRGLIFSGSRLQEVATSGQQKRLAGWLDRFANRDFAYLLFAVACINRPGWFLWIAGIGASVFGFLFYRTLSRSGDT